MDRTVAHAERLVIQSLTNQLNLAVKLLRTAKRARETVAREDEVIASARDAYRHSLKALRRMPQLTPEDMAVVEERFRAFRSALRELVQ